MIHSHFSKSVYNMVPAHFRCGSASLFMISVKPGKFSAFGGMNWNWADSGFYCKFRVPSVMIYLVFFYSWGVNSCHSLFSTNPVFTDFMIFSALLSSSFSWPKSTLISPFFKSSFLGDESYLGCYCQIMTLDSVFFQAWRNLTGRCSLIMSSESAPEKSCDSPSIARSRAFIPMPRARHPLATCDYFL